MRMNDFPTVFRQAQRRTFQNSVESYGNLRREQVHLIDEKKTSVTHSQRQRAILIPHTSFMQGNMTTQVSKLQTSMSRHFEHRIVQACGKLLDEARFS